MEDNKDFENEETQVMGAPGETQEFNMPEPVDDGDGGDSSGKKTTVTVFGREFPKRKAIAAGLGIVCALAVVGGCIALAVGSQGQDGEPVSQEQPVDATEDDEEETYAIQVGAKAEGWVEGESSPVIVHVVSESEGIDYYHAYSANEEVALDVPAEGGYEVSFITPVNADGSVYEVPDAQTVQAEVVDEDAGDESGATGAEPELPFEFTLKKAEDVTADELSAVAKAVAEAVKRGDETLTGEDGVKVVELVEKNCKANPNADAEAVEEETEKASESAASEESKAETGTKVGSFSGSDSSKGNSGSTSGGSNGNSGSGSNNGSKGDSGGSGSGSSTKPSHTHNWVAQTQTVHHDAQYKTVHHDAQYQTVHHDAVTEEHHICNGCNADITGNESAHLKANVLNGCGGWHSSWVTVQEAYDEQVLVQAAYDEQVLVSGAWDETVTTGYKCSSCGATK